jgi:hypothetical protein
MQLGDLSVWMSKSLHQYQKIIFRQNNTLYRNIEYFPTVFKSEARLPIPAGILRIPVFSVPVALFSQESRFLFRRNFFGTPSEILSVWACVGCYVGNEFVRKKT